MYNDLDYEHEVDIFANQTRYTRALSSYDIFVAKLEAGYDEQLMIKSLVESYELRISKNAHLNRNICAVSALERIYEAYGFHTLDKQRNDETSCDARKHANEICGYPLRTCFR